MQVVAEHEANNGGWPINANPPPLRPPAHLLSRFTLNNSIVYNIDYRDESVPSAYVSYSRQSIDEFIVEASAIACKCVRKLLAETIFHVAQVLWVDRCLHS
jgi:hypothetical protein